MSLKITVKVDNVSRLRLNDSVGRAYAANNEQKQNNNKGALEACFKRSDARVEWTLSIHRLYRDVGVQLLDYLIEIN